MANKKISELTTATALVGTEEFAIVQGGVTKKGIIDNIKTYFNSFFITKKAIVTNASVTGAFNLDASVTDTYNLTLTGNTTLALLNFSATYAEPMTVYMFGNFAVTYPAGAKVLGTYSTTKTNQLVVEKVGSTTFITVNNYV